MSHEEFDRCFEAFLQGTLSAEDAARLKTALQEPQWQSRWRELSDLEGMLAEEFKVATDAAQNPAPATPAGVGRARVLRRPARLSQSRRQRSFFSHGQLAAAAAVVLVLSIVAVQFMRSKPETVAEGVAIQSVSGDVAILRDGVRTPATNTQKLAIGEVLLAAAGARANLRFDDGTTITLGTDSESRLTLRSVTSVQGKQLLLDRGSLEASVAPQAKDKPLVVRTPTAEIKVLGTVFVLRAALDSARLEVKTGRVRMEHIADGKAVEVGGGQYAVAAKGIALVAQPLALKPVTQSVFTLFNGKDLSGWNITHGTWIVENGVVIGANPTGKFSRLESAHPYFNGDLVCKLRVSGVPFAEIQFGEYRELLSLHFGKPGIWKELKVSIRGRTITGTLDGVPLELSQSGETRGAAGILAFYSPANSSLEIQDAQFTEALP